MGWGGSGPPPPPPNCAKNSGPTEAECDEQCRLYRQENSSCGSRSYCLRSFNGLTKESASCCAGDKYNNQSQCCVKVPIPNNQYVIAEKNKPFAEQPGLLESISNQIPPSFFSGQPLQSVETPLSNKGKLDWIPMDPNNTAVDGCSVPDVGQAATFPPGLFINKAVPATLVNPHPNADFFYDGCAQHDVCYQQCGTEQSTCDSALYETLKSRCELIPDNVPGTGFYALTSLGTQTRSLRSECFLNAGKVYAGLYIGGKAAHSLRQRERCNVCQ